MKKIIAVILSLLTLSFALFSCDNAEETSESSENSSCEGTEESSLEIPTETQTNTDEEKESLTDEESGYPKINNLCLSLSNDGTYYSVSYYDFSSSISGEKRDVVIPAFYEGIPITKIQRGAFDRIEDEPMDSDYSLYYAEIVTLYIPETITEIGAYALSLSSLEKITVSENNPIYSSLDGILYSKDKTSLICYPKAKTKKSVTVPEGTQTIARGAFYVCTEMSNLVLPSTLKTIEASAFQGCTHLLSVTLPENLEIIEENAFKYCHKLVEVINKSSLELEIGSQTNGSVAEYALVVHKSDSVLEKNEEGYVFIKDNPTDTYYLLAYNGTDGALTLPENSKFGQYKIYKYAFYANSDISEMTLSKDVIEIGSNAFDACHNLKRVEINDMEAYLKTSLVSYSSSPFYAGGAELFVDGALQAELTTPTTITEIKPYAFYSCTSIERLVITDNIISIGEQAFMYNWKLAQIVVADGLKSIKDGAFRYSGITKVSFAQGLEEIGAFAFAQNFDLEEVILPDGVTEIGKAAFFNCPELKRVTLGEGIVSINESVFGGANKLESINIPEGVTQIKEYAFMDCFTLEKMTLPSTTKSIGEYAFWDCRALRGVYMPYGVNIASTAFKNCQASREYYK